MGCQANYVCVTCKKDYYCGYGSYGGLDERAKKAPQKEHASHETHLYTEDYTQTDKDGTLCFVWEFGLEPWIKGHSSFEFIDVSEEKE